MTYDFNHQLTWSLGQQRLSDIETLQAMIPGCVSVSDATRAQQGLGVDYVATLRKGAEILIDAKTRSAGCSKFWFPSGRPELALEFWSVMPDGKFNTPKDSAKTGWTLAEDKQTDLILFKFDPSDSQTVYLVSFQLLRMAFRANANEWRQRFKLDVQESSRNGSGWQSEAVFVPATEVYEAMRRVSVGALVDSNQELLFR